MSDPKQHGVAHLNQRPIMPKVPPLHPTLHARMVGTLIEMMSDALFVLDANGVIQFANLPAQKLVGLQEQALIGQPIFQVLEGIVSRETWQTMQQQGNSSMNPPSKAPQAFNE